jgi:flavodoxin
MKFLVAYFSSGGKTKKVATAIAQELGCEAVDVAEDIPWGDVPCCGKRQLWWDAW